jgi:hypothetical protein
MTSTSHCGVAHTYNNGCLHRFKALLVPFFLLLLVDGVHNACILFIHESDCGSKGIFGGLAPNFHLLHNINQSSCQHVIHLYA